MLVWLLLLTVLLPVCSAADASPALAVMLRSGGLSLRIEPAGSYALSVDGARWMQSSPPRYLPGVQIIPAKVEQREGSDQMGHFSAASISWEAGDAPGRPVLQTEFRAYSEAATADGGDELIVFTQRYVKGIKDTSAHYNQTVPAKTSTCTEISDRLPHATGGLGSTKKMPLSATTATALGAFPAFSLERTATTLNWFTPQGNQLSATAFGRFAPLRFNAENGQNSMPLVLYDSAGRSIALTPLDNFFVAVHETTTDADVFAAGPAASVHTIPDGFEYSTALSSAGRGLLGVNATLFGAGSLLLGLSGKLRADAYRDSFVLSHLGYWVDNGSPYYHRNTSYGVSKGLGACNARLNCTLQDALLAVRDDARERDIPLRYFQFDDHEALDAYHWPSSTTAPYRNPESYAQVNAGDLVFQSGVTFLGPDPWNTSERFPLSLYIGHGDTRICDATHDGPRCPEVQNRSAPTGFEWYDGICVNPSFFEMLMRWGQSAGMAMFEQDFICSTQGPTSANLTLGSDWFRALDAAALLAGVDVQLCMMGAAHALASTTMRSVSNGRGTQDHADRSVADGLPLGWSSLALFALGLWPSRDNVWTNSSVDLGDSKFGPDTLREKMPELQTAIAVLAGGPYGVADIAGALNRSLVMSSCRDDGVMLRPSWPATAIDASFRLSFESLVPLYLWAAHSDLPGGLRYTYLLSINLNAPLTLPLSDVLGSGAPPGTSDYIVTEGWHGLSRRVVRRLSRHTNGTLVLPATPQINRAHAGHSFWAVAPVLAGGWAYLGEPSKLVKASHRRVVAIDGAQPTLLRVHLLLARAEEVTAAVLTPSGEVVHGMCRAASGAAMAERQSANEVVVPPFFDVDVRMTLACTASASSVAVRGSCSCTTGHT